jgi:hypothetical protein
MQPNSRKCVGVDMKEKIIDLLICIAHISAKMKSLSLELDKVYDVLGDADFIDYINNIKE